MANDTMRQPQLQAEQCQCINDVLEAMAYTEELIRRCKDCTIDVSKAEEEQSAQRRLAEGIKRNFFPQAI